MEKCYPNALVNFSASHYTVVNNSSKGENNQDGYVIKWGTKITNASINQASIFGGEIWPRNTDVFK